MTQESENKPARRVEDKRAEVPLIWSETAQASASVPAASVPVDVMIDIETLGTTPGSAILSIGAVVFGPEGLGDTFYAPVLLQSCTAVGLTIDPNTIAWWMQQSDEARAAAFRTDADAIADVLEQFTCWYGLVGAERPWCHGATFDVPLLEAAYKACGMKAPWRFYDVRNTRTLYDLARVKVNRSTGTLHNALDDATAQAEAAARAMRTLDVHATMSTAPLPAAEKPTGDLTDEQIDAIATNYAGLGGIEDYRSFARAIERAAIAAHLARQPKAEQQEQRSNELHNAIMNLPCERTMSHFATRDTMIAYKEGHRDARHAAAELALGAEVAPAGAQNALPQLTVWEGAMPESNGKSNFTAVLHRKDSEGFDIFTDGFQFARSEYPDRVRYEADFMRWLIGERDVKPELLDDCYDFDKHSGYVSPSKPSAGAQNAEAIRNQALEDAAKLCDEICSDYLDQYKGRGKHAPNNPNRANSHTEGVGDGADMCSDAIRALQTGSANTQEGGEHG